MYEVKGKVCLITGGLGGIGFALAKVLLKNGLMGIALVDLVDDDTKSNLLKELGSKAIFVRCDITDESSVKDAFYGTFKKFNRLDIVINCAGICNEVNWKRTIDINLTALYGITRAAMQDFLPRYAQGEGLIVNVASVAGLLPFVQCPIYSATKHAVVSLGKCFKDKYYKEKFNTKVITVCPGISDTKLFSSILKGEGVENIENLKAVVDKFPMQSTEELGRKFMEVIRRAETGSVWIAEAGKEIEEIQYKVFGEV